MKNKEVDAVQLMRRIRDEMSQRYIKVPKAEKDDLQRIREKYRIAPPTEKAKAT